MRTQLIVPSDWRTVVGSSEVDLPKALLRRVEIDLISEGASIYLASGVDEETGEVSRSLLWCGVGSARVVVAVEGEAKLVVEQQQFFSTAFRIPELRAVDAAWRRTASFADLDPPKPFAVSPEIEAVVNRMNQNAIRREMLLLQALDRRMNVPK
nr:MAG: hypothetical protein [Microvirus sp.]